jgi:hypothetical protein
MAATLINGANLTFGIPEDESGLVIESLNVTFDQKQKPVLSKQGETVGMALYDQKAKISIAGLVKGSTGLPATTLIAAMAALANVAKTYGHGVANTGSVIVDSIKRDLQVEDFEKLSVEATRYPLMIVAP